MNMKQLKQIVQKIIPRSWDLPLRYAHRKMTGRLDVELAILRKERPSCVRAIDIGANIGIYSYGFARYCKKVESFEPVVHCTKMLCAYAEKHRNITVHHFGLSNRSGTTTLYVPLLPGSTTENVGLASFTDPGGKREMHAIQIARLDDFSFRDVGVIKVDVEGHEMEVLQGAAATISRERPLLLVEIEQRHLKGISMEDVFNSILSMGYRGGFMCGAKHHPLEDFAYETHQKPFLDRMDSGSYVNNFLFSPRDIQ